MPRDYDFWVYIMASASGTLYTGVTNDIERRVREHKEKRHVGFTSRYKCNRLVYRERFQWVHAAIAREKQIKSWSRARKIALIESRNPRWEDFSRLFGVEYDFPRPWEYKG